MGTRKTWAVALAWFVLHLAMYAYLGEHGAGLGGFQVGIDFQEYRQAALAYQQNRALYDLTGPTMSSVNNYRYHPLYAALFPLWLTWPAWVALLGLAELLGLYFWHRTLTTFGVDASQYLWLALVAFDLLGTLFYGNVAPFLMAASGALFLTLRTRQWLLAGILTTILIMVKFYWAFPLIYLFWMKEYRALTQVIAVTLVSLTLASLIIPSSAMRDWLVFLVTEPRRFPWAGQEAMFATAQNSSYQTFARYLGTGIAPAILALAFETFIVIRYLQQGHHLQQLRTANRGVLLLTLAAYPTVMLTLPEMNEAILGSVILACLWACKAGRAVTVPLTLLCIAPHILGLLSTAVGRADLAPALTLPVVFLYVAGQWAVSLSVLPSRS